MKPFAELYARLDATTKTNEKLAAMVDYFRDAPPEDAAWAIYFLSGRRPKRLIQARLLRQWAAELAGIPEWLLVESHSAVGDSAETAALLLPSAVDRVERPLHVWMDEHVLPLGRLDEDAKRERVVEWWRGVDGTERFVLNKLLTGAFRVGVSQRLLTRALGRFSGLEESAVAHRLMGLWEPTPEFYGALLSEDTDDADSSRPYPFYLAYALEDEPARFEDTLGNPDAWQVEWKWDGIRAQLIRRAGETFLWSRGEELVTDRYPEVAAAAEHLPDGTVLDGELLPWADGGVLPFGELQRRIGRKKVGKKLLAEVPVILLAYDLLEHGGEDIRPQPQIRRREALESVVELAEHPNLLLSEVVRADGWTELVELRAESRARRVEGLMLKRRDAPYGVGRRRGDWWKWKIDPYTVDAVLVYAQRGSGRRASLYSDYTFAVWNAEGELVPFAKAYSGLTDAEMRRVDHFVRRNIQERFGPVRSVSPELVFELAFENIQRSSRHKSGIAVRFPRILRWREDKKPADADTLATLEVLLPSIEA